MSTWSRANFSRFSEIVLDYWVSNLVGVTGTGWPVLSRQMLSVSNEVAIAGIRSGYFDAEQYSRWRDTLDDTATSFLYSPTSVPFETRARPERFVRGRRNTRYSGGNIRPNRPLPETDLSDLVVVSLVLEELTQSPEVTQMLAALHEPDAGRWPFAPSAYVTPLLADFDSLAESAQVLSSEIIGDAWAIDGYYGWQKHLVQLGESVLEEYLRFCQVSDFAVETISRQRHAETMAPDVGDRYSQLVMASFPTLDPASLVRLVELWRTTSGWWTSPARLTTDSDPTDGRQIRQAIRREINPATEPRDSRQLWDATQFPTNPMDLVITDLTNVYRSALRPRRLYVEARARGFARTLIKADSGGPNDESYRSLVSAYEVER